MTYSYSTARDRMIRLDDVWLRASQIESVKIEPGSSTALEDVTVGMLSGTTHTRTLNKGEGRKLIDMIMGHDNG